MTLQYRKLEIL